jgi:hypothetical protein
MVFGTNEAMMFHPLLHHYGWGYGIGVGNLRVHYYFDSDKVRRRKAAVDGATLTHIVTIAEGAPMNSNHLHAANRKARAERAEKNEAFGFKAREYKRLKQVALAREATL